MQNQFCQGCGIPLVNWNKPDCQRCFQIKHYNRINNNNLPDQIVYFAPDQIQLKANQPVILVIDLFDLFWGLVNNLQNHTPLLIAINKFQLLPKHLQNHHTQQKITNYIRQQGWEQPIVFYDAKTCYEVDEVLAWIGSQKVTNQFPVIILGNSNAGKSTLLNALCEAVGQKGQLTTANALNTTLANQTIVLPNMGQLQDTPGFFQTHHSMHFLTNNPAQVKFWQWKKMVWQSFQIYGSNQLFFVENFLQIAILQTNLQKTASIHFLVPNHWHIHRTKQVKQKAISQQANRLFTYHLAQPEQTKQATFENLARHTKTTFLISGVGYVITKNIIKLTLTLPKAMELKKGILW